MRFLFSILLTCCAAGAANITNLYTGQQLYPGLQLTTVPSSSSWQMVFAGNELFAPGYAETEAASGLMWITNGTLVGDVSASKRFYAYFGLLRTNSIIDAELSEIYYTDDATNMHSGVVSRIQDRLNFAGMVLINVAGGQFQVIDRVAGVETWTVVPNLTLSTNTRYWVHLDNSSGETWTAKLLSADRTVVIAETNGTFTAGVPASGYQGIHTYATKVTVYNCAVSDSGSNTLISSSTLFERKYGDNPASGGYYGGCAVTNGVLTFYSDGSFETANNWQFLLSSIEASDFQMTGSMKVVSGRGGGFIFRQNESQSGYAFFYDDALSALKCYKLTAGSFDQLSAETVSLSGGTWYPFTLRAVGTNFSCILNGVTNSTSDDTYTASGKTGILGYQSQFAYTNIVVSSP